MRPEIDSEMIARVLTEHLQYAGDKVQAPTWLIRALGDIHEKISYTLQAAEAANKRSEHRIPLEAIQPTDVIVQPVTIKMGKMAVCLSERAFDTPHCFALMATPNPRWTPHRAEPDDMPVLAADAPAIEPQFLVMVLEEHPGDFSRTRLISVDDESMREIQRQLAILHFHETVFFYVSFLQLEE